jgi:exosome complex component RRP4
MNKEDNGLEDSSEGFENESTEVKREIVIPGEIIASGEDALPGDGSKREGDNVIAIRYGLKEKSGRLVKVIPLSGIYSPRRGNVIISRVVDITFNGWMSEINSPYSAFLPVAEVPKYLNKNDLDTFLAIGDMYVAKVTSVKRRGIDLTVKGKGLGKVEGGIIININSNKVPRVIGKEGSMIKLVQEKTNCNIVVGQNGIVWIQGDNIEDELLAKEAILFVTKRSFINGLTEKIKDWFDKKDKENSKK